MTWKKRLVYFGFGLVLGIIALNFIWDKKGTTFEYMPNARTLKVLREKPRFYSSSAVEQIKALSNDDVLEFLLKEGKVDFNSKQNTKEVYTSIPLTTFNNKPKIDTCFQYAITVYDKDINGISIDSIIKNPMFKNHVQGFVKNDCESQSGSVPFIVIDSVYQQMLKPTHKLNYKQKETYQESCTNYKVRAIYNGGNMLLEAENCKNYVVIKSLSVE